MKTVTRTLTSLIGVLLIWLAITMATGLSLIRPSATEEGEMPLEITRTWYGEAMRYGSAGLLGFFGLTLTVAPWRKRG